LKYSQIIEVLVDRDVNERFSQIRYDEKLTKKEFAEALGISGTIISDIENGNREPSKELMLKASVYFAISLNWLYLGLGEKSLGKAADSAIKVGPQWMTTVDARLSAIEHRLSSMEAILKTLPS
jgi:transcriptional regulator with XRE-family HTH domain